MGASKRRRIEPTHDWQLLLPLFEWPEQERYEQIRPLMLFDVSVTERAAEMGTSTSTLYRRLARFAEEGLEVPLRRPGRQEQEAAAGPLRLHGRHLAAVRRHVSRHPCDSHTSQG